MYSNTKCVSAINSKKIKFRMIFTLKPPQINTYVVVGKEIGHRGGQR